MPDFGDRRVMACTPGDLKRWLGEFCGIPALAAQSSGLEGTDRPGVKRASTHQSFPHTPVGAVSVDAGGFPLTIRWRVLDPRRIALLKIEQLELEFAYPPHAMELARDWIARFDRHTQRGGG